MTLRHLNIFVTVCECGTMRKASDILHIAQPAISASISEIEKYYHIELFERINQRLVITDTGRELLIKAKAVLSAFDDFEAAAKNDADNPVVNIGSTLTIGKTMLPAILKEIREKLPQVRPAVTICRVSQIEELILSGELDFAFIEGEPVSEYLEKLFVSSDRLTVICGNGYQVKKLIALEELVRHPLLLREDGSASRKVLDQVIKNHGLDYTAFITSQSNEAVLAAVKENLGIAVLPYSLVREDLKCDLLKEIQVEQISFDRNFYLVKHKKRNFGINQQKTFDFCKTYFY